MTGNGEHWSGVEQPELTDREFHKFAAFIYEKCGIKLSLAKKTMLISRLNRRLRKLRIASFKEYFDYVSSPEGQAEELVSMIDEVSTNKTEFFREEDHFTFLTSKVLPKYAAKANGASRVLQVWSAGCSSGEEPYTLAMVLAEYAAANPWFDFAITATDICTKVLAIAERGVYPNDRLDSVPSYFRQKYMMRGKGEQAGAHRMVPELRRKISFQRLNFQEKELEVKKVRMDIIFCRNVIIYFDRETQIQLFRKFYRQLAPGGFFFIGHSETLPGLDDKVQRIAPAVYWAIA